MCLPLLIFSCTIKSRSSLFWHRLTRVIPEKGRKTVVVVVVIIIIIIIISLDHEISLSSPDI